MTNETLSDILAVARARVEAALDAQLPGASEEPRQLHEAMRYAVLNGGKRVRAALVYLSGRAVSAPEERLDTPAIAVELIHAYSLVHDDLPAMDNDDLRRGQPTCHIAFDEATALLAGDAMQTHAFQLLAQASALNFPGGPALPMIATLASASGSGGMAGGQAIDLAAVGQQLTLPELENMHAHKTGALIRAAVRIGALAADSVDATTLAALDNYAAAIGLAFQIQDDILDVVGDTAVLGKQQGADEALGKPTYPALVGLERAREMAAAQHAQALASIATLDARADPLRSLSEYIVNRTH
jgi:geranylgeranyl pyrophosphate synthase